MFSVYIYSCYKKDALNVPHQSVLREKIKRFLLHLGKYISELECNSGSLKATPLFPECSKKLRLCESFDEGNLSVSLRRG